ncbi:MAG: phosphoribosylformylglycinamidine synthase subunit PurQ [Rhodospirillales bacterium]|nr:phosphoribosylformylglycinamidine synthase subunit PurQ [Rhodospirillales bacterium]
MNAAVIVFPGSNCDRDVALALEQVTGRIPAMVWHRETTLPSFDLIVVPGGFSYGDYLRCGAIAAHSPVMRAVKQRAEEGIAVLGICNGFQVLTEAGLLPGVLLRNAGLRFICRDTLLRVESENTPFTRGYRRGQVVRMPIAHNEGNYFADEETIARLEGEGRIAFRYCDERGLVPESANPNGSLGNIAGIVNRRGNVLGMMPHPERLADPLLGGTDGRALFEGLLAAV